jgi:glycosyltransferase involved in cell wall biosynthesis
VTTATVVVCTHNRAHLLDRVLEASVDEARSVGADVLVVDNASTDDTPAVLDATTRRLGPVLHVVREPRLGLSVARNRALAEARGDVAVFIDDDAVPRPGWLRELLAAYDSERVACVGGRVLLHLPGPPPPWLTSRLHGALSGYDLGDAPRRLNGCAPHEYPFGANVSFRVAAARALGGFSRVFGVRGHRQLAHEETDLCARLDRSGAEIRYVPSAVVDHWVLPDRLSPHFFLQRYAERGQSAALFELRNLGLRRTLALLRRYYGPPVFTRAYVPNHPVDPDRLFAECRRREGFGYCLGLVRGLLTFPLLRTTVVRLEVPGDFC